MKTCQLHCTPVSVSNTGYSGLSPGLYTGKSVSDKVYEDQCHLHCYLVCQSVTQGITACQLTFTPEYQSAAKYMKTCQLHCTPMYQSVTWAAFHKLLISAKFVNVRNVHMKFVRKSDKCFTNGFVRRTSHMKFVATLYFRRYETNART